MNLQLRVSRPPASFKCPHLLLCFLPPFPHPLPVSVQRVPFTGELVGGLAIGRSITVRGETSQNADRYMMSHNYVFYTDLG